MKILLAFNGSRLSEAALRTVITQRRPERTEVKVLKVIPLDVTEEEVRQAQGSLDLTVQALRTAGFRAERDRKSTRLNSSHGYISYAVFCLKKKKKQGRSTYSSTLYSHNPTARATSTPDC